MMNWKEVNEKEYYYNEPHGHMNVCQIGDKWDWDAHCESLIALFDHDLNHGSEDTLEKAKQKAEEYFNKYAIAV